MLNPERIKMAKSLNEANLMGLGLDQEKRQAISEMKVSEKAEIVEAFIFQDLNHISAASKVKEHRDSYFHLYYKKKVGIEFALEMLTRGFNACLQITT